MNSDDINNHPVLRTFSPEFRARFETEPELVERVLAGAAADQAKRDADNAMPKPYVGQPATYSIGSDRYAMQVTAVKRNGLLVEAQSLNRDGTVGGMTREFTRRNRRGGGYRYVSKGDSYGGLTLGHAETYMDPSF